MFEKPAGALAREKLLSAAIVLTVVVASGAVFVLVDELPLIVSVAAAGAMFLGTIVFLKIIREARDIMKNGEPWRVMITERQLIWASPVAKIMEPFEVDLKDIRATRRVFITKKNSKVSPKNKYYIDLWDGSSIEVSDQLSAIEPRKVFKALQDLGFEYQETTSRQGGNYKVISGS